MFDLHEIIAAQDELCGPSPQSWYDRFEREEPGIDEALEAALRADTGLGLNAASLLGRFWFARGRLDKGRRWLGRFLQATSGERTPERASALTAASDIAFRQSDNETAKAYANEALELAQSLTQLDIATTALTNLARTGLRDRDPEAVRKYAGEVRRIAIEIGDEPKELQAIHCLAEAERMAGRLDIARGFYSESLARNRGRGATLMIAVELSNFGYVEKAAGNLDAAEKSVRESLELCQSINNKYLHAHALVALAAIVAAAGRAAEAARHLGEADRLLKETGLTLDPADKPEYDAAMKTARAALGGEEFEQLYGGAVPV